jgi:hypothetical protein
MIVRYEDDAAAVRLFLYPRVNGREPHRGGIVSGSGNAPEACTISLSNTPRRPVFLLKRIVIMGKVIPVSNEELREKAEKAE